jgi:hypothetical protein
MSGRNLRRAWRRAKRGDDDPILDRAYAQSGFSAAIVVGIVDGEWMVIGPEMGELYDARAVKDLIEAAKRLWRVSLESDNADAAVLALVAKHGH